MTNIRPRRWLAAIVVPVLAVILAAGPAAAREPDSGAGSDAPASTSSSPASTAPASTGAGSTAPASTGTGSTGTAAAEPQLVEGLLPVTAYRGARALSSFTLSNAIDDGGGTQTQRLSIEATTLSSAEGELVFDAAGDPLGPRSWLVLAESDRTVQLAPGEQQEVPFGVLTPNTAEPGDYGAAFRITDTSTGEIRHVGVLIRVWGEERDRSIEFTELELSYSPAPFPFLPGQAVLSYSLTNTGDLFVAGTLVSGVNTVFSKELRFLVSTDSLFLFPGESLHVSVQAPAWPTVRFDPFATFDRTTTLADGQTVQVAVATTTGTSPLIVAPLREVATLLGIVLTAGLVWSGARLVQVLRTRRGRIRP